MTRDRSGLRTERGVYGRAALPLLTAAEAAAADASAREEHGIPARVLMESAGRAAALVAHRVWPRGRIIGLAGPGNNGGDLLVMLRVLQAWGRDVAIIAAAPRDPDGAVLHSCGLELLRGEAAEQAFTRADVVVDGMLGTGAAGEPRDSVATWVQRLSSSGRPVCALDVPTGVDATTGAVHGTAVRADVTVTFGWPKLGTMLHPARAHCGRLIVVEIGFPRQCATGRARLITSEFVRAQLRPREATAHKGTAGRLLILAGQEGMAGAAALAGGAAIRAGAGLIRIASSQANRVILQSLVPEATFLDRTQVTAEHAEPMHALLAGPGLGTDAEARAALTELLTLMQGKPVLLDADALNLMAEEPEWLQRVAGQSPCVITPHARELSRLTGMHLENILGDVVGAARSAAARFQCIVLLKGQPSLVAAPDGELDVNSVGSSDVATAGMGDQLAGTCAALLAAGYPLRMAAALGLFIGGRAADIASLGRSLTPADVNARLGAALADPGPTRSPLNLPFITFDQPSRW